MYLAQDCNEAIAIALKQGWIMDGINPSHMDDYWREYEAKRDITGTVADNNAYDMHLYHIRFVIYRILYSQHFDDSTEIFYVFLLRYIYGMISYRYHYFIRNK